MFQKSIEIVHYRLLSVSETSSTSFGWLEKSTFPPAIMLESVTNIWLVTFSSDVGKIIYLIKIQFLPMSTGISI